MGFIQGGRDFDWKQKKLNPYSCLASKHGASRFQIPDSRFQNMTDITLLLTIDH